MKYELTLKCHERKSICTCGHSKSLPYCDNTHREINEKYNAPFKSVKITNHSLEKISLEIECSNWNIENQIDSKPFSNS